VLFDVRQKNKTMEKLGLILNFAGTVVIWIDAFVLSSYIAPNQIILRGDAGCKILISKFFLHVGLLLVLTGFLLQLLAYDDNQVVPNQPNSQTRESGNQVAPNNPVDMVAPKSQPHVVPAPTANP
jgi:hypothetical protein